MADTDRQFSWRQGDVITHEAAKALHLLASENDDQHFAVVVSHDCDLTASVDKEPDAEVIVGRQADRQTWRRLLWQDRPAPSYRISVRRRPHRD